MYPNQTHPMKRIARITYTRINIRHNRVTQVGTFTAQDCPLCEIDVIILLLGTVETDRKHNEDIAIIKVRINDG